MPLNIDFRKSEYSLCYTEEYSFYWNCNYVATYFYKSVNASVIKYVKIFFFATRDCKIYFIITIVI